jgi:hypothetical protein
VRRQHRLWLRLGSLNAYRNNHTNANTHTNTYAYAHANPATEPSSRYHHHGA